MRPAPDWGASDHLREGAQVPALEQRSGVVDCRWRVDFRQPSHGNAMFARRENDFVVSGGRAAAKTLMRAKPEFVNARVTLEQAEEFVGWSVEVPPLEPDKQRCVNAAASNQGNAGCWVVVRRPVQRRLGNEARWCRIQHDNGRSQRGALAVRAQALEHVLVRGNQRIPGADDRYRGSATRFAMQDGSHGRPALSAVHCRSQEDESNASWLPTAASASALAGARKPIQRSGVTMRGSSEAQ